MRKISLASILIILTFLFLSTSLFAQGPPIMPRGSASITYTDQYLLVPKGFGIPSLPDTSSFTGWDKTGSIIYVNQGGNKGFWYRDSIAGGHLWVKTGTSSDNILPAGPFTTSNIAVGFNPGTNITAAQILEKVFYGLKPPTATLTGGTTLEYIPGSTSSQTLNWSAGRQSNTATISSIVVGGVSQSFSQPSQGSSVSGTQGVAVPANTNTTYTNVVTTSDGQIATASTTFPWSPRKYYGFISDTTGIASGSQDAAIRALTTVLSTTKTLTTNTGNPSGSKFYVYCYLSSLGAISSITFNGIPATDAITTVSKSFTTANGFNGTYYILYTKNAQTTSSDVIFQ